MLTTALAPMLNVPKLAIAEPLLWLMLSALPFCVIVAAPYVTLPPVGRAFAAGAAAMDEIFHVRRMAATAIADMRNGETAAGIFN
ncbi:hypothetical protein [Paraburkholderia sediminicola]|uniref:hypothetical protein n=1 Tax=Paraburkholderia sediminicola TaxID=458836 RepID=UPI0038BB2FFF